MKESALVFLSVIVFVVLFSLIVAIVLSSRVSLSRRTDTALANFSSRFLPPTLGPEDISSQVGYGNFRLIVDDPGKIFNLARDLQIVAPSGVVINVVSGEKRLVRSIKIKLQESPFFQVRDGLLQGGRPVSTVSYDFPSYDALEIRIEVHPDSWRRMINKEFDERVLTQWVNLELYRGLLLLSPRASDDDKYLELYTAYENSMSNYEAGQMPLLIRY